MELDDLKSIWKKHTVHPVKDEAQIAAMLKGSSRSIVSKLKRSVWFELAFTLVAGIGLLLYALTLPTGPLKHITISVLVVFIGYSIYYVKKLSLLNKFDSASDNIRSNLERLISALSNYLRYYKRSYTILYPVYFSIGVIFGGMERGEDFFESLLNEPRTLLLLIAFALAFFFCSTWLVNWLLRKLYGNHLEKLKQLLNDIHE